MAITVKQELIDKISVTEDDAAKAVIVQKLNQLIFSLVFFCLSLFLINYCHTLVVD
jgi:hypothetical protein